MYYKGKWLPIKDREIRFPVYYPRTRTIPDHWRPLCQQLSDELKALSWVDLSDYSRLPDPMIERLLERHEFEYYRCIDCGALTIRGKSYYDHKEVCRDCQDGWVHTEDGVFMRSEDAYQDDHGEWWSEEPEPTHEVEDYHRHPHRAHKQKFFKSRPEDKFKDDSVRLGFELEYNSTDRLQDSESIDELPFAFSERDGSLSSYAGLEVITGWSTLGTVLYWVDKVYQCIDIDNLDNAGLHVTVSGLSSTEFAKLITFINRNKQLTVAVAGRESSEYARFTDLRLANWLFQAFEFELRTVKHVAVNVRDCRTCEIRVFSSSDEAEVTKGRIQYAWAVAKFCQQPGLNLSTERFKQWLADNPWASKACKELFKLVPELKPKRFLKRVSNYSKSEVQPVQALAEQPCKV